MYSYSSKRGIIISYQKYLISIPSRYVITFFKNLLKNH